MSTELSHEFFIGNRKRLIGQLPKGTVVMIPAHSSVQRSDEVTYRFSQNRYFYYLCGIEQPDLLLVLAQDGTEMIITPNYNSFNLTWEVGLSDADLQKTSGIKTILTKKQAAPHLQKLVKSKTTIYTLFPDAKRNLMPAANSSIRTNLKWLKQQWPSNTLKDIRPLIVKQRMVKQPAELALIQKAINITGDSLGKIQKQIKAGTQEIELDRSLLAEFWANGADGEGFESIVSAGKNACVIHYMAKQSKLKAGELIIFDVGAEVSNYAADISRTYSVSSRMNKLQNDIYKRVLETQLEILNLLKPGILIKELQVLADQKLGQHFVELGLINDANSREQVRRYFPHAIGHHLGLDLHDPADYTVPLKPNMVLAIEPGIYIPEEGIGIRLEDDVLITKNGIKILSQAIPK